MNVEDKNVEDINALGGADWIFTWTGMFTRKYHNYIYIYAHN